MDGHIHYDGTPELMAEYARLARDSGAVIVGGCCGTTPDHLRHMRAALDAHVPRPAPTLAEIEAVLGGFSSLDDGLGTPARQRVRRGRR